MKTLKPAAAVLAAIAALVSTSSSKTVLESRGGATSRIASAKAWSLVPSDFNPFDAVAPLNYALRRYQPRQ